MKGLFVGAVLCASFIASSAGAAVIDFDNLGGPDNFYFYHSVTTDGYSLATGSLESGGALVVWGDPQQQFDADPDGYAIANRTAGTNFIFERGVQPFDFLSIELAEVGQPVAGDVEFTFLGFSGSSTQTVTLDGIAGLETFTFNLTNLQTVYITPKTLTHIQLDNIVVQATAAAPVPEPATWAMMLLGFGVIGSALRRRQGQALPA